ncbi:hypothetical protein LINPERPRIM_LOCUS10733, partial [Linum perenne]
MNFRSPNRRPPKRVLLMATTRYKRPREPGGVEGFGDSVSLRNVPPVAVRDQASPPESGNSGASSVQNRTSTGCPASNFTAGVDMQSSESQPEHGYPRTRVPPLSNPAGVSGTIRGTVKAQLEHGNPRTPVPPLSKPAGMSGTSRGTAEAQ